MVSKFKIGDLVKHKKSNIVFTVKRPEYYRFFSDPFRKRPLVECWRKICWYEAGLRMDYDRREEWKYFTESELEITEKKPRTIVQMMFDNALGRLDREINKTMQYLEIPQPVEESKES